MENFKVIERKEDSVLLDVIIGADEKKCFIEAKKLFGEYKEVRFCFNGRNIVLTKENFSTVAEMEGFRV